MSVLIVFKNPKADNPAACHVGLGVTAHNTTECLVEYGVDAHAVAVVDGFYLRDKVLRVALPGCLPTHVILCAPFFDTKFLEQLCAEFPQIHFSVVFHSNAGFLGADNWSTQVICEQVALSLRRSNFTVGVNCDKFARTVRLGLNGPCALLPNLYYLHGPIERARGPYRPGKTLRIGAFGATRVLKNLPTAAWAALVLANAIGDPTEFWVSQGREEGHGSQAVLKNIEALYRNKPHIKLVLAPWAPWMEFRRTMRRMDILMQPSFTESFNGVTADGIAEGVASVVSHAIDWVPRHWQANADDPVEIACVAQRLLFDASAPKDGYRALKRHNDEAAKLWKHFLHD